MTKISSMLFYLIFSLIDYLLQREYRYFMFRDFQTRNIMIRSGEPYFIDYQGGRKGALQYDLASLLFQAKANIPGDIRRELLDHYLDTATQLVDIVQSKQFEPFDKIKGTSSMLTVTVNSFSYKSGVPADPSGNSGGFVFDCRFIHNPGRYETYKS